MNIVYVLLSSSLFFILPILSGTYFTLILNKKRLSNYFLFEAFGIGSLILYAICLITHKIGGAHLISLIPIQVIAVSTLSTIAFSITGIKSGSFLSNNIKNKTYTAIVLLLIAVSVYTIWRFDSPVTATLNWDLYHHQTLANIINRGNLAIITTDLSDTFKFAGYTTLFHTLLSVAQQYINADILSYWWFLEFFHLIFTIAASYVIGISLTKSKYCGVVSAILGGYAFESFGAYTSLFLIPQNLSATLGAVLISNVIYRYNNSKTLISATQLMLLTCVFLTHFVIGSYIIALYIMTTLFLAATKLKRLEKIYNWLLLSVILGFLVLPFIFTHIDLSWLNRGEAEFFNFSLKQKDMYIKTIYGLAFYILIPLGILHIIMSKKVEYKPILLITIAGLTLLFSPIPYSTKLYAVSRYFTHVVMALGVWLFTKNLNKYLKAASLIALTLTFLTIYTVNVITYKQVPFYKNISTHVSPGEINAAKFLKENYRNKNVLLVSEPATMHILEALSGINTPGGAYATEDTRKVLNNIYYSRNSKIMALQIMTLKDGLLNEKPQTYLLAVGGRFAEWQKASNKDKMGIHWNVWQPYDLKPADWEGYEFIDFVKRYSKFKEVYRNSSIVIFEVQNNAKIFD